MLMRDVNVNKTNADTKGRAQASGRASSDFCAGARAFGVSAFAPARLAVALASLLTAVPQAYAVDTEEVVVVGRQTNLFGRAQSASQGVVGAVDLETRPLSRSGELLEVVPGTAVTQHSGSGKANQYFLRGFNLDHGTDFAAFIDGVPLNLPTHGHGQGYLDLNPIIPEFVNTISYGKGPYYADVGDFSSAGYAKYALKSELDQSFVKFGIGEYNFRRGVVGGSTDLATGQILGGLEVQYYDGPWVLPEDGLRVNTLLKYSNPESVWSPSVTAMFYDAEWNSTDQVPQRAINQGLISRYGNIDDTLGGNSTRASLSGAFDRDFGAGALTGNAYALYYDFELFSNFTYFLDDPVNGDQIKQTDTRTVFGGDVTYTAPGELFGRTLDWRTGVQARHDRISDVALYSSEARLVNGTTRRDSVVQTSLGLFGEIDMDLTSRLRMVLGSRLDTYWFDVDARLPAALASTNSGRASDAILTPKLSLIYAVSDSTEWFTNFGQGFHSNDARGTTTTVDPASGDAAVPVDPLARTTGAETGMRVNWGPRQNSTLSFWWLSSASELVFVGDAGTTEPNDGSHRYGVELTNYYAVNDWLTLDFDLALTKARFKDDQDPNTLGKQAYIPQAVGRVVSAGATVDHPSGVFGALRLRHFGNTPLNEAGTVKPDSTSVVNLRAGYRWLEQVEVALDVFNLFNSTDPDIAYFYESQLAGEAAGVEDIHLHPVEPRALRGTVTFYFD